MDLKNNMDGHKVIVMSIEHYNPLSLIRSLGKNGIAPIYIAIKGKEKIASSSRYVSLAHYVDTIEEAYALLLDRYGNEEKEPFVLTGDDVTISLLDKHYDELKGRFLVFNAGQAGRINAYMDKFAILELAKKHGLNVLDTVVVERGTIPENISYPIITKSISPVIGGWKSDVHICENEDDLKNAFASIRSEKVLIQRYVDKKNEYTLEGFCIDQGSSTCIPISISYNYLLKGYYSPYFTVKDADKEEINRSLAAMFREIGFEGIFEAEFIMDNDGTLYFSEINFRNSPWSYPSAFVDMPIPYYWLESMLKHEITLKKVPVPEGFTGMNEPVDYEKRVNGFMIAQAQWLYDFKTADVTFYYDKDDPEPYYLMMNNFKKFS